MLAVQLVRDAFVSVDDIENEISVVLQGRSKDHNLVRFRHHFYELLRERTHEELTSIFQLGSW